jgi:hypothetical protein
MRHLLPALAATLCLFASGPSAAQTDQADAACDGTHCQWVILEGLDVQGAAATTNGTHLTVRPTARFGRRAPLARSFSPELQATLSDAALTP